MDQAPRWADGRTVVVKLLPAGQSAGESARRAVPAPPELPGQEGTTVQLFRGQGPERDADALPDWVRWGYSGDMAAVDVVAGAVTLLAEDQLVMWWDVSPDGSTLAFSAIAGIDAEAAGFTIHTVPTNGGSVQAMPGRLLRPFGDGVSWSPTGDRLAYVSEGGVYVVHTGAGERERVADARGGWADDAGPVWTRDGRSLVFTDGDLWRVPLEGDGGPERVASIEGHAIHAVVTGPERVPARKGSGEWLVGLNDDETGETGFARVDPVTGAMSAERLQPGRMSASLRLAATSDGRRIVVSFSSATRAPELWVLGPDLAPAQQVTRMNPAFDSVAMGETRLLTWATRAGDTVHGTLTLPPTHRKGQPVPMVVEVYGGGAVGASPHSFDRYRQLFATHGYAVFVPGIPLEVGTPMRGHADAVVPAAQGNMAGAFGQLAEDGTSRTQWAERGQGRMGTTPWADPQRYVENSPLFYLDRVEAPVLLLHGAEDRTVPLHLAGEIFIGLQHLGRTVTLARYAGEGHSWRAWRTANKMDYWQRTLDWFDRYLR